MRLATWRRTMFAVGGAFLLLGAVLMVGGGLYAGRAQYDASGGVVMAGIWAGTVGTLGVVSGVVMLKLAVFGPVPKSMQAEARAEQEASD